MSVTRVGNIAAFFGGKGNTDIAPTSQGSDQAPKTKPVALTSPSGPSTGNNPKAANAAQSDPVKFYEKIKASLLHRQAKIAQHEANIAKTEQKREELIQQAAEGSPETRNLIEGLLPFMDMTISSLKDVVKNEKVEVPRELYLIEGRIAQARRESTPQPTASSATIGLPTVDALNLLDKSQLSE